MKEDGYLVLGDMREAPSTNYGGPANNMSILGSTECCRLSLVAAAWWQPERAWRRGLFGARQHRRDAGGVGKAVTI